MMVLQSCARESLKPLWHKCKTAIIVLLWTC